MAKDGSQEKSVLRLCTVHVGHEVYAKDYTYYFNSDEIPIKYLTTNSGVAHRMAASRDGIFYGKSGIEAWNPNHIEPPIPFTKVRRIFHSLDASLDAFSAP
jgi:hypothetical protein